MNKNNMNDRNNQNSNGQSGKRKKSLVDFLKILLIAFLVGLLLPLRPSVSETEKRELTKFPTFTISSFLSGDYFSEISTWYADTYPFREDLISVANQFKNLYGLKSEQLVGSIGNSDDTEDQDSLNGKLDDDDSYFGGIPTFSTESVQNPTTSDEGTQVTDTAPITDSGNLTTVPITDSVTEPTTEPVTGPTTDPDTPDTGNGSETETNTGEGEQVGSVYVKGDTIFELYYYNKSASSRYATLLSDFAAKQKDGVTVYSIIVPKAYGLYLSSSTYGKLGCPDEETVIKEIYSQMSGVKKIGIYSYLESKKSEYIYFRTDHHWTALGAYYAYQCFCAAKGIVPDELSSYTQVSYEGFLGSLYSSANQPAQALKNPDTVIAYIPKSTNLFRFYDRTSGWLTWNIITNVSGYSAAGKYSTFIGGDNPYSEIVNPDKNDGSACVVVKDSFGNAFVPFLVDDYQYVYVVDFRYYSSYSSGSLTDLIEEKNIQDVIFVNNISMVGTSSLIDRMENILQ
jgi:hypothetical protein